MPDAPPTRPAVDLSVDVAGLHLANPLMTASGTSGYGPEYAPVVDLRQFGAFVTKAVSTQERKGNRPQRIVETPGGMLNAIGLANVGLERFCAEKIEYLRELGVPVIVNVVGYSIEDYLTVCRRLDALEGVSALELNVSCPNVANGLEFGTDPGRLRELVAAARQVVSRAKLIVKLSPNVTDIAATAQAAVEGGAEALAVINTVRGMAVDIHAWKPILANRVGGVSGPAIKPIALAMVDEVYRKVGRPRNVPIIGMGGITTWHDAVEFLLAGATALAVGTALFVDPRTPLHICDGLAQYLHKRGLASVRELIGRLG